MCGTSAGRIARGVGLALGGAALVLVGAAGPAAAHTAGGPVPAPPWLLGYLGAFLVLVSALALRAGWIRVPALAGTGDDPGPEARPRPVAMRPGQLVGLVLLGLVVAAAIVGPDAYASNVAPVAVYVSWLLVPFLSLVVGDVVRALNPYVPLVRLVEGGRSRLSGEGPIWIPAALLASVAWYFLAYHRPGSPRALAVYLVSYALVVVALGIRYGSRWVLAGEGLGALSAAVSTVAPLRRSPAPPGTAAVIVVWVGSVLFDGLTSTTLWDDVAADVVGWERTLRSTLGLAWAIGLVGAAYLIALWAARIRLGDTEPAEGVDLRLALGASLVPLGLAWFIGHDLSLLIFEGQNLIALLSDPIGRGWDLLGTVTDTLDYGLAQEAWVSWVQIAALGIGHVAAVLVAHRVARSLLPTRPAMTVTWAMAGLAAVSVVAGALMLL